MNPWILWLIKSVYGVVWRDSMLVFDENWNGRELWKKSEGKRVNSAISGQNRTLVLVPLWDGTGTADAVAKRYRYHPKWYRWVVPVPPSRTGSVPVPNIVVPVPLVSTTPVFCIFA